MINADTAEFWHDEETTSRQTDSQTDIFSVDLQKPQQLSCVTYGIKYYDYRMFLIH